MAVYTINTHSPSPRPPAPRKPASQWTVTAVGALVVTAVGLLGWWLWPEHVPSPEASPVTLVKFASTDRFARMSEQEKQPYVDALSKIPRRDLFGAARDANLSQDERMNAMENVMGGRMQKQLDAFFVLPMGAQRDAYLDKMIDEQERNMREWMQRAATRPARADGAGGGSNGNGGEARNRQGRGQGGQNFYSAERMKRRIENTPPARRAQAAEFWAAMRARREARGLCPTCAARAAERASTFGRRACSPILRPTPQRRASSPATRTPRSPTIFDYMCGRYTLIDLGQVHQHLPRGSPRRNDARPRYNVCPMQPIAVVANQDPPRLEFFNWGLVPSWASDPKIGNRMINARAETLAAKPAFRDAFRKRRCLILADGFYEWQPRPDGGRGKIPTTFVARTAGRSPSPASGTSGARATRSCSRARSSPASRMSLCDPSTIACRSSSRPTGSSNGSPRPRRARGASAAAQALPRGANGTRRRHLVAAERTCRAGSGDAVRRMTRRAPCYGKNGATVQRMIR
jgi:hypothetical protein